MKAFPTNFTHEGFVASVDAEVSVEGGAAVECFGAYCAFVRLLVGVNDFVATQGASLTEAFVADLKERKEQVMTTMPCLPNKVQIETRLAPMPSSQKRITAPSLKQNVSSANRRSVLIKKSPIFQIRPFDGSLLDNTTQAM